MCYVVFICTIVNVSDGISQCVFLGQDKCPESQQCGWCLLHSCWRLGLGNAGGSDRVLLQVQGRGQENEGGKQ